MRRADARIQTTYAAVMNAPVTGPADVLAKLKAAKSYLWEFDDDHDGDDQDEALLIAICRDLEALAATA
jgi:hypothetical protein